jgi:hypothetical protein
LKSEIIIVYLNNNNNNNNNNKMNLNFKKMGFNSEEEYNDFLDRKMENLMNRIKNDEELLNVFKRLKDK